MSDTKQALAARITDYLSGGGLFNPELADHNAVRDLLIECRDAIAAQPVAGAQVAPLTDEQVQRAWQDQGGVAKPGWIYSFARAIERAHGIGTGEQA